MELFLKPDTWLALLTLCFLEIILGIDNIIFISILSNKIRKEQQKKARNIGLLLAMGVRILFLFGITWIIGFTQPLFTLSKNFIIDQEIVFSVRDIILGLGGLFLTAKSTIEINHKMIDQREENGNEKNKKPYVSLATVIWQIVLLDIIFSFDSILTAVGMVNHISIMIIAIIVSIIIMMFFMGYISEHIQKNPSIEMLALSFLILIGFTLILESLHKEVPKGYIYFAISFSLLVELINIKLRRKKKFSSEHTHNL